MWGRGVGVTSSDTMMEVGRDGVKGNSGLYEGVVTWLESTGAETVWEGTEVRKRVGWEDSPRENENK